MIVKMKNGTHKKNGDYFFEAFNFEENSSASPLSEAMPPVSPIRLRPVECRP